MRIAYFTDSYYPQQNGVSTFVRYSVRSLIKKGHTVHIFCPKIKGYKDKEDYIHRIPSIRLLPSLPDNIRLPLPIPHKTIWEIIKFDFDVVHAHGNGLFSLIGLVAARSKKVPYILTFHTQVGRYTHYFLKGKVIRPALVNAVLLKRFGNLCDGVITPSKKMQQELIKAGVKKEIEIIPNFLDLSRFNIKNDHFLHDGFNVAKNIPILLTVGRLGKEKNFEFMLEIFSEVLKRDDKVYLFIVGEGLGKKELIKIAKKLKIYKRVIFTGGINIDLMPKVYADADIFVFPSTSEVHPMVAIEAAAAKLPLVVANDGAFDGLVINNKNGFRLPPDKTIFADKIIQLLKSPQICRKFGLESRKIVEKNYNPDILSDRLIKYYKTIIENCRQANGKKESMLTNLWNKFSRKLKFIEI